ncbi:unnamed protein product [Closterium sp. Naga37s-1]|nr:unnamed protein product [Closterium sp. Naga37s-1]
MGSACFKAKAGAEPGEREQNKSREEQRQQPIAESDQPQQQQQETEGAVAEKRQQEQPQPDGQRQPSDGAACTDQGPGKAQPSEQQQGAAVADEGRGVESNGIPAGPAAAAAAAASQPQPQLESQTRPQQNPATESSAAAANNYNRSSGGGTVSGNDNGGGNGSGKAAAGPGFRRMALEELMAATNNFSEKNVVSEGGRQALNVVYRGVLGPEGLQVAVKRFQKKEWEDAQQFAADATAVGSTRYPSLTSLLGFCLPLLLRSLRPCTLHIHKTPSLLSSLHSTAHPTGRRHGSGQHSLPGAHIAAGLLPSLPSNLPGLLLSFNPLEPNPTAHPTGRRHGSGQHSLPGAHIAAGPLLSPHPNIFPSYLPSPPSDTHTQQADATAVGSIRYPGLTSLLGFCCEGEHRLLVSDFMPNCTLAQHLFHCKAL